MRASNNANVTVSSGKLSNNGKLFTTAKKLVSRQANAGIGGFVRESISASNNAGVADKSAFIDAATAKQDQGFASHYSEGVKGSESV